MITLGALLIFSGFFSGYNTSRKAVFAADSRLGAWMREHPRGAKAAGLLFLVCALAVLISDKGIGAGTFVFFTLLMVLGSLIVLLSPLKIVTLKAAGIAFAAAFLIELLNLA